MTSLCLPLLVLSLIILIRSDVITKYVECIQISGSNPSSLDPKSTATCPSTHILTSCESKPIKIGNYNDEIFGSSIENDNSCVSWTDYNNGWILDGIRAYARCCKLTDYGSSFIKTYASTLSSSSDDAIASVSCPQPNEKLIGCTGITTQGLWDGSYVGNGHIYSSTITNTNNTCYSMNGASSSGGSYAIARCYDNTLINDEYNLQCLSIWGQQTTSISTAECPSNDYFMTSCNGYSPWSSIGQYMIQNNICTVTHLTAGDWTIANAVCCRLSKPTNNPTNNPTKTPTVNPSNIPTIIPSIKPTIEPTLYPTYIPTINTIYPSITPTINTQQPSNNPSIFPTQIPTLNPSLYPTINPTPTPTIKLIITSPTPPPIVLKKTTSDYEIEVIVTTNDNVNVFVSNISETILSKSESMNLISILSISFAILLLCICIIWICLCLKQRNKYKESTDNINKNKKIIIISNKKQSNVIEMEEIESKTNVLSDGYDETGTGTGTGTIIMRSSIKETDSGYMNRLNNDEFIINDDDCDDHIDIITPGTMDNEHKYITNNGSFNDNNEVITGSDNDQTDQGTGTEGDTDENYNINTFDHDNDMDIINDINIETVQ